ncbi:MAG: AEC family transporter [Elusimicrobiales bacterium]
MVEPFVVIFLGILSGYIFAYFYKERKSFDKALNDYLYYIALPITIFLKIFSSKIVGAGLNIILINSIPILFIYILVYIFYRFSLFTPSFARTLIIASTLGNLVYLGFNLVGFTYGERAIAYAAVSVAIQNIVIFSFGVFFLNSICYEDSYIVIGIKKSLLNPIFLSTLAGFSFNLFSLKLPQYINLLFEQISKTTLPLSIFLIGVSLYGKKLNLSYIKKVIIIFFFKAFVLPFVAFLVIYLLGYYNINSAISFLLYTMPLAVACYVVARDFELELDVVSGSIFFTTLAYFVVYWLYSYILKIFF